MKLELEHPVAIGGLGGSGTRVIAAFFDNIGYYPGDDLNETHDNLWFTLIFKHRSILLTSDAKFRALVSLFFSRMSGRTNFCDQERAQIRELAETQRIQHASEWLKQRAVSFCDGMTSRRPYQPWYWKEPNTHIVIDRLLGVAPELRYIHVVRHPIYMAVSKNQNQLGFWGPIFLNQDVVIEPRLSLSYWCAAHRRVVKVMRTWPERTMMIDFDSLCANPKFHLAQIETFVGAALSEEACDRFRGYLKLPDSSSSFVSEGHLNQFDPADLAYVAELGYLP